MCNCNIARRNRFPNDTAYTFGGPGMCVLVHWLRPRNANGTNSGARNGVSVRSGLTTGATRKNQTAAHLCHCVAAPWHVSASLLECFHFGVFVILSVCIFGDVLFSKRQRITLRLLYAIGRPSVVCLSSVCLSVVCDVGAPYSGGWTFRQFFFTIR